MKELGNSTEKTIFTYIDRFGKEWIIFDYFFKDFIGFDNNHYYKCRKVLLNLREINADILKSDYLGNYESLDITGQFVKKIYGKRFVMDCNFFANRFFSKEILVPLFKVLNIKIADTDDIKLTTDIERKFYLAKKLVEKYLLPQLNTESKNHNNTNSTVKSTEFANKYDEEINKSVSLSVGNYLSELSYTLKETALSLVLKANNIENADIERFNDLVDKKIDLINAKISKKIILSIKDFVKTPNEINPLYTDTTDRIVDSDGIKYVLKNGQKFPLITARPDKDRYFSIGDFLMEKGYSLIYSREFGYVVAMKLRSQNIPMMKYLTTVNSDPKNGVNYYPREIYGLIENIFDNWVRKTKFAVIVDSKSKSKKKVV